MRASIVALIVAGVSAGCQRAAVLPEGPAPAACTLQAFESAPGETLPPLKPRPKVRDKSQPEPIAQKYPFGHGPADLGAWVDAAPGWKAWRYWLRSEAGKSVAIHVQPLSLPPGAEMWVCSPDRETRQGPIRGSGLGGVGQYWSPHVPGPELWIEVFAPANAIGDVELAIPEVFAGYP